MADILVRAGCFVAIIALGIVLRRVGFFKREDFKLLSRIVINITLPAAVVTNFSSRELDRSMLLLIPVGLVYGIVIMLVSFLLNRRRGRAAQSFAVLNSAGVNIGNFVLPFAQGFLGPAGVMAVSLFDVGNGTICLGGAYAVAGLILREDRKRFSVMPILRTLVKSVPFMTYVIMCLLNLLRVSLPGPVVSFAGIIGNANAFLAMLMLGVGFRIDGKRLGEAFRTLAPRYLIGLALACLCFFFLPAWREALVILFLGPVASAAPAYTAQLKGDYELASAINSFSILISIVLIVAALLIMA